MTLERYREIRHQLLREILRGDYGDDRRLPTEWQLVDRHGVSRVTVRKALETLRSDGVVESATRRGTLVAERRGGFPTTLDPVALIAPAHLPFFADFAQRFDQLATDHGALALFKQDYAGTALADERLFLRLVERGIRNAVIWPHTPHIDLALLARLRAVGVNLVCFDQVVDSPLVDSVAVDHEHAVASLLDAIGDVPGEVVMVGYSDGGILSEALRQAAFSTQRPGAEHLLVSRQDSEAELRAALRGLRRRRQRPGALLATNGPLGSLLDHCLARGHWRPRIATIDCWPMMLGRDLIAYRQPMAAMAEAAFGCLLDQCRLGERWRGRRLLLRGEIVHTREGGA